MKNGWGTGQSADSKAHAANMRATEYKTQMLGGQILQGENMRTALCSLSPRDQVCLTVLGNHPQVSLHKLVIVSATDETLQHPKTLQEKRDQAFANVSEMALMLPKETLIARTAATML